MQIDFRILNENDLNSYRNIRTECLKAVPDNFGTLLSEELYSNDPKFKKFICHPGKDGFFYGAFRTNSLIGICGFITEGRQKTGHRGEIVQVYINQGFWGLGIGKYLITQVLKKAFEYQNIDQVILSAVRSNSNATRLYQKLGFEKYGELNNYFKAGNKSWSQTFMFLTREKFESLINKGSLEITAD